MGCAALGAWHFVPRENSGMRKDGDRKGEKVLPVRYIVMQERNLTDAIDINGTLNPEEEVELSFEASGKITALFFKEGTSVKKGTLLAKINDAPLQAQLRKLEAQLKLMHDRLFRQRALLQKEAVSKEAFQEAEANLSALQAEIDMKRAEIAQTELRAPFDGVIGLRKVSAGAYATPSTSVATLTCESSLKVEFSLPERYAGLLKTGSELTFTLEGDLTKRKARVYACDSHVDKDTRTYTVRARYDNSGLELVPGRYVNVHLVAHVWPRALAVPSQALVSEMGVDKVFVAKDGTAQPVEIVKGLRTDALVQVVHGLRAGDTIITSGTMQLRTGQKIELTQSEK